MRHIMLAAGQNLSKSLIEQVNLIDLLTSATNLSINASNEIYSPTNQQTAGGDGRVYSLKPRADGRLVKSIQANFRYTLNVGALTSFYFYYDPVDAAPAASVGLIDDWNNQSAFKLISDEHNFALQGGTWNNVLKKTFDTPVKMEDIFVRIGGRSGYTYTPIYMKDLTIEFVKP